MVVRFLLCCRGNFSASSFVSTSASVQSELRRFVTTECDSSSVTNISLWYSYTLCLVQSLANIDTTKPAIPFCQPLLFSSLNVIHTYTGEDIMHSIKNGIMCDLLWLRKRLLLQSSKQHCSFLGCLCELLLLPSKKRNEKVEYMYSYFFKFAVVQVQCVVAYMSQCIVWVLCEH